MHFSAEFTGHTLISTHQPDGPVRGAVLLCGPLFHEYYKGHAWLRQTALELAARGCFVLRFDFGGQGDAPGDPEQVSLDGWCADVARAAEVLRQRSGCPHVDVVSVRLATLLLHDGRAGARVHVAVDPVTRGSDCLQELRHRQQQLVRRQPRPVAVDSDPAFEELLGERYPRALLRDLGRLGGCPPADRVIATGFNWSGISLERALLPEATRQIVEALVP